jgi:RimJ/RimL family protein N-acetyltransferase
LPLPGTPVDPILTIRGERVALGPLDRAHVPLWQRWINDLRVTRTLGALLPWPMLAEDEEAWYSAHVGNRDHVTFTIYELPSLRPIGTSGLKQIDRQHGTAEFGILIGEVDAWNRGYGTETARLVADYGFNVLNLHSIQLSVYADNPGGSRAYAKAGYRHIGARRGARHIAGRRVDILYMDITPEDLGRSVLTPILRPDEGR